MKKEKELIEKAKDLIFKNDPTKEEILKMDSELKKSKIKDIDPFWVKWGFFVEKVLYNLKPLPDYGDLYEIDDFQKNCKYNYFIDYDGTGYFATEKEYDNLFYIKPSDIVKKDFKKPYWATHVVWFNK